MADQWSRFTKREVALLDNFTAATAGALEEYADAHDLEDIQLAADQLSDIIDLLLDEEAVLRENWTAWRTVTTAEGSFVDVLAWGTTLTFTPDFATLVDYSPKERSLTGHRLTDNPLESFKKGKLLDIGPELEGVSFPGYRSPLHNQQVSAWLLLSLPGDAAYTGKSQEITSKGVVWTVDGEWTTAVSARLAPSPTREDIRTRLLEGQVSFNILARRAYLRAVGHTGAGATSALEEDLRAGAQAGDLVPETEVPSEAPGEQAAYWVLQGTEFNWYLNRTGDEVLRIGPGSIVATPEELAQAWSAGQAPTPAPMLRYWADRELPGIDVNGLISGNFPHVIEVFPIPPGEGPAGFWVDTPDGTWLVSPDGRRAHVYKPRNLVDPPATVEVDSVTVPVRGAQPRVGTWRPASYSEREKLRKCSSVEVDTVTAYASTHSVGRTAAHKTLIGMAHELAKQRNIQVKYHRKPGQSLTYLVAASCGYVLTFTTAGTRLMEVEVEEGALPLGVFMRQAEVAAGDATLAAEGMAAGDFRVSARAVKGYSIRKDMSKFSHPALVEASIRESIRRAVEAGKPVQDTGGDPAKTFWTLTAEGLDYVFSTDGTTLMHVKNTGDLTVEAHTDEDPA